MGVVDRRKALLDNIARLRHVERELPPSKDLAAVKAALEQELGGAVSMRMAAQALGVSHTALGRWVESGDLPTVFDSDGRQKVPVDALLDLQENVTAARGEGNRSLHFLEQAMSGARERAAQLEPRSLVPDAGSALSGHRRAELRSLAYHRALARELGRPMADDALRQVWKWRAQGKIDPRYASRWEEILRRPVAQVRRAIGEDSDAANALRQTSPFAGMLSEPERRKILQEIR
jgi:hypothetical protein